MYVYTHRKKEEKLPKNLPRKFAFPIVYIKVQFMQIIANFVYSLVLHFHNYVIETCLTWNFSDIYVIAT